MIKIKRIFSAIAVLAAAIFMCTMTVAAEYIEYDPTSEEKSLQNMNLPAQYADLFAYKTISNNEGSIGYRVYVPEDYDNNKSYPMILFMHGAARRGNNNKDQLNGGMMYQFFTKNRHLAHECIIVAPQCPLEPARWVNTAWAGGSYSIADGDATCATFTNELKLAKMAADVTMNEYSIDPDRIYISGMSMGGYATWNMLAHYPTFFAAANAMAGAGDPSTAALFKDVPTWCFHGDADTTVPYSGSRDMYEALVAAGSTCARFTRMKGMGHNCQAAYAQAELWEWMFSQSLKTADTADLIMRIAQVQAGMQTDATATALVYANEVAVAQVVTPDMVTRAMEMLNAASPETIISEAPNESAVAPTASVAENKQLKTASAVLGVVAVLAVVTVVIIVILKKKE